MARLILFLSAAALALSACGAADPAATEERVLTAKAGLTGDGEVSIVDASVRLNANPDAPSAAYFTVKGGDLAATVTGVQTADAERAEIHESKMVGGMMRMNAVSDVDVPANGEVRFRQGGLHVMLFGLSEAARAAGKVTLSVSFADGTTRDVEAPLLSVTATADAPPPPRTLLPPPPGEPGSVPVNTGRQRPAVPPPAPVDTPDPEAHDGYEMASGSQHDVD